MFSKTIKFSSMPMPSNIHYWWNFGSLLALCLAIQIISGLLLSMFYENNMIDSFSSISQIERNINYGWLIRSLHANTASMFFLFIYIHISRGLFYKSFNLKYVWMSGFTILMLLFAIAFLGYVLPWGQMSFWGATVITNLLSSIPYIGTHMTLWLWGSFSINKPTLMRFFSLHFLLPMVMTLIIIIHLTFLHQKKSNNPLGLNSNIDSIPFQPFFLWKDIMGIMISFILVINISLIFPFLLMDPDNFSPANPLSTPPHIQPEWYFLFAYAILRTIPNKLGGVIALLMAIFIIFTLPFMTKTKKHTMKNKQIYKALLLFWWINFMFLTVMGAMTIEYPFVELSSMSSLIYFLFFSYIL
uniref:Cytochrome b n=1 Tax=Neoseiulus womersleyi TaxID=322050 RepID=A0A8F6U369_9ACAR|nr:cytochrome b [Neoseiulus womersleyi]